MNLGSNEDGKKGEQVANCVMLVEINTPDVMLVEINTPDSHKHSRNMRAKSE